ncbi:ribonuclease HII [Albidovulum sp.]
MTGLPDFELERQALDAGARRVAGVDEAGRGPLCGPVVAAAVCLSPGRIPAGLNDSKKLAPRRRAALFEAIIGAADFGIGEASVAEIDALNILGATHLAMRRAIAALAAPPDHLLIDGNSLPGDLAVPARAVIGGDARSLSIAAASILAKVWRDRIMVDLAQQHPGYGWERNAGYPTRDHLAALRDLGVTPHHRRSFRPVHKILCQEKTLTR